MHSVTPVIEEDGGKNVHIWTHTFEVSNTYHHIHRAP